MRQKPEKSGETSKSRKFSRKSGRSGNPASHFKDYLIVIEANTEKTDFDVVL
jgi:hypothetical protein